MTSNKKGLVAKLDFLCWMSGLFPQREAEKLGHPEGFQAELHPVKRRIGWFGHLIRMSPGRLSGGQVPLRIPSRRAKQSG